MITTIYFVRHAEPDYSVHNDSLRPLTEKGRIDAIKVSDYLNDKNIDVILSSPYKRAIDTIRPFAANHNIDIKLIEDFRERKVDSCWIDDFQSFTERQWNDFDYKLSDGECLSEVQTRNIAALKNVLTEYAGKNIVIGTHGTALSTIINYYNSSYGYKEFSKIKSLMPWIVKFTFDKTNCLAIEKRNC